MLIFARFEFDSAHLQVTLSLIKDTKTSDYRLFTFTNSLTGVWVPYYLLQCIVPADCKKDIDLYYNQIVNCLERVEAAVVPLQRARCNTQKHIWSLDPNLKNLKK